MKDEFWAQATVNYHRYSAKYLKKTKKTKKNQNQQTNQTKQNTLA